MSRGGFTYHAKKRHEQRYDGDENVDVLVHKALNYGIYIHQVPTDLELYWFMDGKAQFQNKKIKLLQGYVFVFTKTGNRLITMYAIPDEFKEEYESIRHIEDENKEKHKAHR